MIQPPYQPSGKHTLVDGKGVSYAALNDGAFLAAVLCEAAVVAGASVLNVFTKQFEPQGVSVAVVLSESHITIHTYPECGVFMADVFTCGDDCDPELAGHYLVKALDCLDFNLRTIRRG